MGDEITVALNRRARHDFTIDETFEAGLVLTGTEIKSLRAGKANLSDAYARMERGEADVSVREKADRLLRAENGKPVEGAEIGPDHLVADPFHDRGGERAERFDVEVFGDVAG